MKKHARPEKKRRYGTRPRYEKDDKGKWWYVVKTTAHGWTRNSAEERQCVVCLLTFLAITASPKRYCSASCEGKDRKGERAPSWAGGRALDSRGYRLIHIPIEDRKGKQKYEYEHRKVMATMLGRQLDSRDHVHHRNGIRTDNRPENLEHWRLPRRQPPGQRFGEQAICGHCGGTGIAPSP